MKHSEELGPVIFGTSLPLVSPGGSFDPLFTYLSNVFKTVNSTLRGYALYNSKSHIRRRNKVLNQIVEQMDIPTIYFAENPPEHFSGQGVHLTVVDAKPRVRPQARKYSQSLGPLYSLRRVLVSYTRTLDVVLRDLGDPVLSLPEGVNGRPGMEPLYDCALLTAIIGYMYMGIRASVFSLGLEFTIVQVADEARILPPAYRDPTQLGILDRLS